MLKALSVSMLMWFQVRDLSSATEMAASSALLIVNLSGVACTSIVIVVCVVGNTAAAPSVSLPLTREPSVYTKSVGSHLRENGLM